MFADLTIAHIFVTLGYALAAVCLLLLWLFTKQDPRISAAARLSNGVLAFYALCIVLMTAALLAKAVWVEKETGLPYFNFVKPALPLLGVLVIWAFPYARRHPLWLLIPFALLINWINVWQNDSHQMILGLFHSEPVVLWLICVLYVILITVLYLLSLWAKRIMADNQS
jgi:hypothetical protein